MDITENDFYAQKEILFKSKLQESNTYRNCYVAFLDLLGFKKLCGEKIFDCDMIKAVFNDIEMLKFSFDNLLGKAIFSQNIVNDCTFTIMSDSVVISTTQNDAGLAFLLYLCSLIQNMLIKLPNQMLLVRGGISKGEFFKLDNLTFGPALIKAYCLENEIAIYPRVIIDDTIVDDLIKRKIIKINSTMADYIDMKKNRDFESEIALFTAKSDDDNYYYVDYFNAVEILLLSKRTESISKIKNGILNGLNCEDEKIKLKYKWLLNYFNSKMNDNMLHKMSEHIIFEDTTNPQQG